MDKKEPTDAPTKYDYAEIEPKPELVCTDLEYGRFKNNLMQFHCARIGEPNCGEQSPRKYHSKLFLWFTKIHPNVTVTFK